MNMKLFYKELLMPEGMFSLKRYIAVKFSILWIMLKALSLFPSWESVLDHNTSIAIIGVITAATAATIQLTKRTNGNNSNTTEGIN